MIGDGHRLFATGQTLTANPSNSLKYRNPRWHRPCSGQSPMRQDLIVALRTIAKRPGYAGSVVLTLMLGIGASTMMFSLLDAAVLRPLAFRDPDRLVMLWGVAGPDRQVRGAAFPEALDWRAMNHT